MVEFKNEGVKNKFESYPSEIKEKMLYLRSLLFSAYSQDNEKNNVENNIEECLKWGEPSYICRYGSTIRIDWKSKKPEFLNTYFNCKTKLIETFREVYSENLIFEGNRAILIPVDKNLPEAVLTHCFSMAIRYHKIKHLPLLGA